MKKKIIAIAMLATVAFSSFAVLTGCGGGNPTSDLQSSSAVSSQADIFNKVFTTDDFATQEFNGYTFSIPSDWERKEIDSNLYFYANPSVISEFAMITFNKDITEFDDTDIDLFYSSVCESFLNTDKLKCIAPVSENINGIIWHHMTAVGVLPGFSDTYKVEAYVLHQDDALITISFTSEVDATTDYSEILKTIVSSTTKKESVTSSATVEKIDTESQVPSNIETQKETEKITSSEPVTKTETVTTGQRNALRSANSYLNYSAFSREGLIEQLEYEGYSTSEATYAVDHCGADWNEQALKSAKSYLNYSAFSHSGLIDQLEYEGFTSAQAKYGADHCNANWKEQAAKSAESYLKYSSFSRSDLIDQLEYEGFTYEQAVYGVEQNGY